MNDHELLVKALCGELEARERTSFEKQLAESEDLREAHARMTRMLSRYEAIGDEMPRPIPRLVEAGRGARGNRAPSHSLLTAAAAVLLLGGAFVLGQLTVRTDPRLAVLDKELDRLRLEVSRLSLESTTAHEKIAAFQHLSSGDAPRGFAEQIERTLRLDRSPNVRLAAVDALFAQPASAPNTSRIGEILETEPSVAIRFALVDWVGVARPKGWRALMSHTARSNSDAGVRARARSLLALPEGGARRAGESS